MTKNTKNRVHLAVIGVGNMGVAHAEDIVKAEHAELTAVCDIDQEKADRIAAQHSVTAYYDYRDVLADPNVDAVLISTPHYDHVPISIDALENGIHVLVEKPIAVHAKDASKMIDAYEAARAEHPDLVFAAMFMMRTYGFWIKIKDLIDSGEIGQLVRTTWIMTSWFRTQAYYNSGGWRATWAGEGGGVLMNQCPHNLDLYQWLVGMPQRVRGFATLGKYHNIEVEDEVTAYFEHENGMVGHFITSTAESPGTNRLEIVGEYGKLVYENDRLIFYRNRQSMLDIVRESPWAYRKVENWEIEVPYENHGQPGHGLITENFVDAILNGIPLIAPAAEGYHSVAINNAIMLSSLTDRVVEMPIDEDQMEIHLEKLIANSRYEKPAVVQPAWPNVRETIH
jgi:predicted dehydrogenase